MKVYTEADVVALLTEISNYVVDLGKGNKRAFPKEPVGIDITEEEMEVLEEISIEYPVLESILTKLTRE